MTNPITERDIVGRRDELLTIEKKLEALAADRVGGTLLIAGEAGVGKSRLVEALMELATDQQLSVLIGRCIHFGETLLPVAPVVDFMAELDRQLDPEEFDTIIGPAKAEMTGYLPSRTPNPTERSPLEAPRLIELVSGILTRLANQQPLVVVIEDLHWADRTTRDLAGFLSLALRQQPVLLVGTYRSDDLHRRHPLLPALADLQRSARPDRIDLEPFDAATTADFLAALVGHDVEAATVADLLRRSGGNAFYLEELQGSLEPGTPVPMTLREVVLSRSVDLDEDALGLLRVASVAGPHVDVNLLTAVTGFDKATMNTALHHLVDAYFLVEQDHRFRFRHELTREVFADELLPGERSDLHTSLAEALQATEPDRIGEIAHHWYQTANQPEALRTSIDAGIATSVAGGTAEALLHFERALELWSRDAPLNDAVELDHAQLLLIAAEAAFQVQDFKRCIDLARQGCAEMSDADPVARALALYDLMEWLWGAGEPGLDEAAELAFEIIKDEPPSAEVARVLGRVARVDLSGTRMEQSLERTNAALEMALATGDRATEASMLDTLGLHRISTHQPGSVELISQALELALEIEEDHEINRSYINLSEILHFQGREEEAIATALEGIRYAEEHGYRSANSAMLAENASRGLETLGRWDELEPLYDAVLDLRPLDLDVPAPTGLSVLERVMVRRGEIDRARPLLEHDRDAVLTGYYCGTVSVIISALLELDLMEGRAIDRQLVDAAVDLVSHSHYRELLDLMAVALRSEADAATAAGYLGDEAAVVESRRAADGWVGVIAARLEELNVAVSPVDQPLLDQCHAEHARAHGDHHPEAWAQIVLGLEQYERPWPTAYSKWRAAEAVLLGGGRQTEQISEASKNLCEAHQIAVGLRAKPLLSDIEDLASRARIGLDSQTTTPSGDEPEPVPFNLTPRELEVLSLVAEGYSNGRIGKELFINTKTASVHVSNILRKLGASNRIEAAAIATRAGVT